MTERGTFSGADPTGALPGLKYGSLPLSFDQSTAQTVSASLGLASLQAGLLAGGIGLILVLIYCLAYYRMLGILTALSLLLSGVVIYAVLVLLGRYRLHPGPVGHRRVHRGHRHHRRLVRGVLRTPQGRSA